MAADPVDLALGELSFEQAYSRLEELVSQLESADLPLEKSVELYELGMKLARYAGARLDSAELKISQLSLGSDGELGIAPARF